LGAAAIIFLTNATFFGQKPAAKNETNMFLHILNEKRNSFLTLAGNNFE